MVESPVFDKSEHVKRVFGRLFACFILGCIFVDAFIFQVKNAIELFRHLNHGSAYRAADRCFCFFLFSTSNGHTHETTGAAIRLCLGFGNTFNGTAVGDAGG